MFKRILVAIDGSPPGRLALDTAITLARSINAELQPVYVVDSPPAVSDTPGCRPAVLLKTLVEEGEAVTTEAHTLMRAVNVSGTPRIVNGPAFPDLACRIVAAADAFGADLLVLGTHGRGGYRRMILGSVAERTVQLSSRPVLLVPAREKSSERG